MQLPQDFIDELSIVLGSDTKKYIDLFSEPSFRGISVNRLKTEPSALLELLPFSVEKSPFYRDGYYIPSDAQSVGNLALHHAGAFYVQEPSSQYAAELLDVRPGDRVLDLCAAPGGKSAQIASLLGGKGLIWSNEVVKNRANILLSNFERLGIKNGVVSSSRPDVLCPALAGFFDKILVDAPCSGEGMFRKDNSAIAEWSREHVAACAVRQASILKSAVQALRPGGTLVYSTCTYSPDENEMTAEAFLESCPEMEPFDFVSSVSRPTRLSNAARITPIDRGEGSFAARFRKKEDAPLISSPPVKAEGRPGKTYNLKEKNKEVYSFLEDIFREIPKEKVDIIGDRIYLYPDDLPDMRGLGVIRAGVLAGEYVKGRIEPSHSLFASAKPSELNRVLDLSPDDQCLSDFLHGVEIDCDGEKGFTGVAVAGMMLGFGKCSGGRLKNKYPKGLRIC